MTDPMPALPQGFTLDQPEQIATPPLPQGFTIDKPTALQDATDQKLIQLQDLLIEQSRSPTPERQQQITDLRGETNEPDLRGDASQFTPIETRETAGLSPAEVAATTAGRVTGLGFGEIGAEVPSFLRGIKQGALNIGQGVLELTGQLRSTLGDEGADRFLKELDLSRGIEQQRTKKVSGRAPGSALAGEIVGESLALPIPAAKGKTALRTIAKSTGIGATVGGVSAAGRGQDAIDGALLGAGFGAGFGSLTEGAKKIAIRLSNAKGGRFNSDDVAQLVEASKREKIPLFTSDVAPDSPGLAKLDVLAEEIPITGTRAGRVAQSKAQKESASRLLGELSGDIDDFALTAQKGLKDRLGRAKKIAGIKYNKVNSLLNNKGDVEKVKFVEQINKEIQAQQSKGTRANKPLIEILESFRDSPKGNFQVVRSQRSDLAGEISQFYKGENQVIGAKGVDVLQRVKNALESDFENFVKKTGSKEGLAAFRDANKFVQKNTAPFKQGQLKRLISSEEPEKIIAFLSAKGKGSRANLMFDRLDNKGRQAVKAAMISSAVGRAESAGKRFSPAAFATELEKLESTTNIFFKGQEKAQLDGLKKLMRATQRAGQISENPPTGARLLVPAAVGGLGVGSIPGNVALVGGFGQAMKLLNQTKTGRNLLTGLSKSTENTRQFELVIEKINKILARSATTAKLKAKETK